MFPTKSNSNKEVTRIPCGSVCGNMTITSDVSIGGSVETLRARSVTVDVDGVVSGDILESDSVHVLGKVGGSIFSAGLVHVHQGGSVSGDIVCSSAFIEKGALFNGKVKVGE